MKRTLATRHLTYRSLEEDPSYEHPVDRTVRKRVGRRDLQRTAADAATKIVRALGPRKKLWFNYESRADHLRSLREAAYFDVGVEHGIAGACANGLSEPGSNVRPLSEYVVRELLRSGASMRDAQGAAIIAAWALLNGTLGRQARPKRS